MRIDNSILKYYLKNILFINGTAYAGKSTMVKMLAEKFGLIHCGENYNCFPSGKLSPDNLEKVNSKERYDEWLNSGFFTWIRKDTVTDTRLETMNTLARHFGLTE